MVGCASEHLKGIQDVEKITESVGGGIVLSDSILKNRDAIYPEVLKGLGTNFFNLGSRFKDAQKEFEKLAQTILKTGNIKLGKEII